ncbi:DUF4331 domain-containing protein [Marinobacter sp. R17]|uniref:DUF4331 domain-containing protein n=1 Tax=Marinobacter sp. R17 TaxID=2484250 RepID=UPI000F4C113C|nr:DUF4331 domain-containing protein [Marinobacter sp. R17]ROT98270.1 DUF4331 domain-containing protein [Marinobacter sp. R17]
MNLNLKRSLFAVSIAGLCTTPLAGFASSHREAPFITETPKVDGTDFYMFRSYEPGHEDTVTLIANYLPLQDPYGGPNYFDLDDDAIYEIHIDNTADAQEDITFRFDLSDVKQDLQLDIGGEMVSVPLKNIGAIGPAATDTNNVQVRQEYTLEVIRGDRRSGTVQMATNVDTGTETFRKPLDNIGTNSISDYAAYAANHVYDVSLPGCSGNGRVFVGQRKDAFAVNLGEIFDLVNLANPLGARDQGLDTLADANVTSFALEVPTDCLTGSSQTAGGDPVIGGWTTASIRQAQVVNPAPTRNGKGASVKGGAYTQVSRLGMPLVNEVVIGLADKDRFNASEPADDNQFATYVTNPTLPKLLQVVTSGAIQEPQVFPRVDLVAAFLTGLTLKDGGGSVIFSNQPAGVQPADMLRLNTAIPAADPDVNNQSDLGLLASSPDATGFPNGRRPVDDVVDIALRVAIGATLPFFGETDPNSGAPLTDGAVVDRSQLLDGFPYLGTPIPGSPTTP